MLKEETGIDVAFQQPGRLHLCLSEAELEARADAMKRLHNQPAHDPQYPYEMLDRGAVEKMLPQIGPEVVGGSYCPLDGHVQLAAPSSARSTRACSGCGVAYLPNHAVERSSTRGGGSA